MGLRAGATSGLYGSGNFAMGALASGLTAALHDGTALPVAMVMAGSLVVGAGCYYAMARPPSGGISPD